MASIIKIECKDVKDFSKKLDKKLNYSSDVKNAFINMCNDAMENTLSEAEAKTPIVTGELISSWRKNVSRVTQEGESYTKTAINKAFNEDADAIGMEGHYASFVEEGHKKVPWRKSTYGVHMLANAENDTENLLEEIVEDELKKLFRGLLD